MNFIFKCLSLLLLMTLFGVTHADSLKAANFPPSLLFANKPIDPLCFFNMESAGDDINLNKCGLVESEYVNAGQNKFLTKQGFYGFDWKDKNAGFPSEGYSYYKAWNAGNNHYWIYSLNNGGGSGDFTAISLYSRKNNDTVKLKTIDGGDRCNGGITDVKEVKNGMEYSVNMTAFDFLAIAKNNPHHLKAYDDLSACAACCAAKAFYMVDAKLAPELLYVDLGKNSKIDEMSGQGTYHECFNKLFADYVAKGKTQLNQAELQQFVKEFNGQCVRLSIR